MTLKEKMGSKSQKRSKSLHCCKSWLRLVQNQGTKTRSEPHDQSGIL